MKTMYALAASAAFLAAAPAAAADLIDFEGNTSTDYDDRGIQFDGSFDVLDTDFGGAIQVPSGTNYVAVNSTTSNIRFSTPGSPALAAVTDMFGFSLNGLNAGSGFLAGTIVSIFDRAGNLLTTRTFDPIGPNAGRDTIDYSFNAPGIARVQFERVDNPAGPTGFAIDDVSFGTLSAAGVPEPSVWAFLILGFGAVGGAMRRTAKTRTRVRFAA